MQYNLGLQFKQVQNNATRRSNPGPWPIQTQPNTSRHRHQKQQHIIGYVESQPWNRRSFGTLMAVAVSLYLVAPKRVSLGGGGGPAGKVPTCTKDKRFRFFLGKITGNSNEILIPSFN
jgi:hypothetical protein